MTPPKIGLYVFPVPLDEPEEVPPLWAQYQNGEIAAELVREFPLLAQPHPHAVFWRATKFDLVVVDAGGGLSFLYGSHDAASLKRLIDRDAAPLLCAWAAAENLPHDLAQTQHALTHGTWPSEPDCVLQAAAFAHHVQAAFLLRKGGVVYVYGDATGEAIWRRRE